jgi:hypothetical protein
MHLFDKLGAQHFGARFWGKGAGREGFIAALDAAGFNGSHTDVDLRMRRPGGFRLNRFRHLAPPRRHRADAGHNTGDG